MIVKVKVIENIWEFFDCARRVNKQIHYPSEPHPVPVGAVVQSSERPGIGVRSDVHDFTDRACSDDEHKGGIV